MGKLRKTPVLTALLIVIVFLLTPMSAQAWSATTTFSKPSPMYPGESYTFGLEVTNTGSDDMLVEYVFMNPEWESEGYGYTNEQVPKVIKPGESFEFTWFIGVPEGIPTNKNYVFEFTIDAADPGFFGGWGSTTRKTVEHTAFLSTPPTPDPTPDENANGASNEDSSAEDYSFDDEIANIIVCGIFLIAIVVIIGVVALVLLKKRTPPSPPPQHPPPQHPPPQHPPL